MYPSKFNVFCQGLCRFSVGIVYCLLCFSLRCCLLLYMLLLLQALRRSVMPTSRSRPCASAHGTRLSITGVLCVFVMLFVMRVYSPCCVVFVLCFLAQSRVVFCVCSGRLTIGPVPTVPVEQKLPSMQYVFLACLLWCFLCCIVWFGSAVCHFIVVFCVTQPIGSARSATSKTNSPPLRSETTLVGTFVALSSPFLLARFYLLHTRAGKLDHCKLCKSHRHLGPTSKPSPSAPVRVYCYCSCCCLPCFLLCVLCLGVVGQEGRRAHTVSDHCRPPTARN